MLSIVLTKDSHFDNAISIWTREDLDRKFREYILKAVGALHSLESLNADTVKFQDSVLHQLDSLFEKRLPRVSLNDPAWDEWFASVSSDTKIMSLLIRCSGYANILVDYKLGTPEMWKAMAHLDTMYNVIMPVHTCTVWEILDSDAYVRVDGRVYWGDYADKLKSVIKAKMHNTVRVTMLLDTADPSCVDALKRLEHHAEELLDLTGWPEITSVHGVKVEPL